MDLKIVLLSMLLLIYQLNIKVFVVVITLSMYISLVWFVSTGYLT